jgi:hypothetical protein
VGRAFLACEACHLGAELRRARGDRANVGGVTEVVARSQLLDLHELRRWTQAIRSLWRTPAPTATGGALPLYFPNRIEVTFADGSRDAAQIDLPAGSLAAPTLDAALRAKFLTEVSPALGAERAEAGLAAALAADRLPIDELIAALRVTR